MRYHIYGINYFYNIKLTRTAVPRDFVTQVAQRLAHVVAHLGIPLASLSTTLGYDTPATLYGALAGKTIPAMDKLATLSGIRDAKGRQLDLHWLLTGVGSAFRRRPSQPEHGPALTLTDEETAIIEALRRVRDRAPVPRERRSTR